MLTTLIQQIKQYQPTIQLPLTSDEERDNIRERAFRAVSNHRKFKNKTIKNPFDPVIFPEEFKQFRGFCLQALKHSRPNQK